MLLGSSLDIFSCRHYDRGCSLCLRMFIFLVRSLSFFVLRKCTEHSPPWADTSPGRHPLWADTPLLADTHPSGQRLSFWADTPFWPDTPWPPPPRQTPPLDRHPPLWADILMGLPGQTPPPRQTPPYGQTPPFWADTPHPSGQTPLTPLGRHPPYPDRHLPPP